ncbi:hypothetical protein MM221_14605 [Salipaludibacillus sp. LMS25]|jgi:hypothetical protein|uniref:hypothetical protein n=1 Tax=Salipaludibacillus sp. LMS25 TaxID=2924031 RepID=UPI0020D00A62|nr:hypothetical protein [Salipaludibacillus sp. LMS25]UTR13833.1 hypothetical protein MM221_14605 [Salipaludibacillus sp. LMS25]
MKKKLFFSIAALIAAVGGLLFYSSLSSPEAKLVRALSTLIEEETIQVESDFTMNYEFDFDSYPFYSHEEEEIITYITDLFEEASGTGSVIYDKEEKVIEVGAIFDLSSEFYGDEIALSIPLSLYLDENKEEIVIDLDAYSTLSSDIIDTLAYNVFPNIPEIEEALAPLHGGEYSGVSTAYELETIFMPVINDYFEGKASIIDFELDKGFFDFGEKEVALTEFLLVKMIEDLESQDEDNQLIQEEDGWIIIKVDDHELADAVLYAFEEIENHDEIAEIFDDVSSLDLEEMIEEVELNVKEFKEYSIGETTISFEIEQNKIVTMKTEMTSTYGENGITAENTSSSTSTFTYGDTAEFQFYGEDRKEVDLDYLFYDLEEALDNYFMELYNEWYYSSGYSSYYEYDYDWDWWDEDDEYDEWDWEYDYDYDDESDETPEDYEEYYDVTEEDLEAIEKQEVTHQDFGLSEEEMYNWVRELEFARLVEPGTAAHYLPRL